MKYGFEIYEDSEGKWRWRLLGEVLTTKNIAASAQSWLDKEEAIAQAKMVSQCPDNTAFHVVEGDASAGEETDDSAIWLKIKKENILFRNNQYYSFRDTTLASLHQNNLPALHDLETVGEMELQEILGTPGRKDFNQIKVWLVDLGLTLRGRNDVT